MRRRRNRIELRVKDASSTPKFSWVVEALESRLLLSAVSWTGDAGDNQWTTPGNWSTHALPGPGDDVTINAPGSPAITLDSGAQAVSVHSLQSSDPLSVVSDQGVTQLSVATTATFSADVAIHGILSGGTYITTAGAALRVQAPNTSEFDNVTVAGAMVLEPGSGLDAVGGLTLNNATVTVTGAILAPVGVQSSFSGSGQVVLDNGELRLGAVGVNNNFAPMTLTLASGVTLHGAGNVDKYHYNDGSGLGPAVAVVNQGTVAADSAERSLVMSIDSFTNSGTVSATNGGTLSLGGTITMTPTAALTGSGEIDMSGTLNNAGATLAVSGPMLTLLGGTILGGTLNFINGGMLVATNSNGTLDAVTVNGNIDARGRETGNYQFNYAALTVKDGLTLNGTATVGNPSTTDVTGYIEFDGSQGLAGNATVVFGNSRSNNELYVPNAPPGQDPWTLSIGPHVLIHGLSGYVGNASSATTSSVINDGTIDSDAAGQTITVGGANLSDTGTLKAENGGTLSLTGAASVDGSGVLESGASGTIIINAGLFGSTQNADWYDPLGTTVFNGSGTAIAPQSLEAMSQDLGPATAGFNRNFAYQMLGLANNTYVRLVDQSHNSTGNGLEAVYVDSLVVPAGCTLDLNGMHLYARIKQVGGTILGGAVTIISAGGPIVYATPVAGTIGSTGEADNWTFFGRAGRLVTVMANPGGPSPQLGWAQVSILDASGNTIASAASVSPGATATLTSFVLPADGTYTIRVQVAAGHAGSVGAYLLSLYDITPGIATLELDQLVTGTINRPYVADQWNFSAAANTQVRLHVLNTSASGLTFSLTGPNGFVGFQSIGTDSDLINLPASGQYTLTVSAAGDATGSYSFALNQISQTNLTLGTPYAGTFAGSGEAQLFDINVTSTNPMLVTLTDDSSGDSNELYLKLGSPPTRTSYDYKFSAPGASQQILVPSAGAGTWYVLLYSPFAAPANAYTISVQQYPVLVTSVTPTSVGNSQPATIAISGAGFDNSTTLQFRGAHGAQFSPAVSTFTSTLLTLDVALTTWPVDVYDIQVSTAGGTSTLQHTFTVTQGGVAHLLTQLTVPSAVGFNIPTRQIIWVQYTNTGTVQMPAPLLQLHGSHGARLTLDAAEAIPTAGFMPLPGSSDTIQALGTGSGPLPLVLQPGDSERFPVYYLGTTQNLHYASVTFSLGTLTADDPRPIDWQSQEPLIRPITMSDATWSSLFPEIQERVGTSWGDYVRALVGVAQQVYSATGSTPSVDQIWDTIFAQPIQQVGASLYGQVNSAGGDPIANVLVEVEDSDGTIAGSGVTSGSGRFGITGLGTGRFNVVVPGYVVADPSSMVAIPDYSASIYLTIVTSPAGAIRGTVVAAGTGLPIAGAHVVATDGAGHEYTGSSATDGSYSLDNVPSGAYSVVAAVSGYAPSPAEQITVASGEVRVGVNMALQLGASLAGFVTRASDQQPVPGADLQVYSNGEFVTAVTAAGDGSFDITALGSGIFTLVVDGQGLARQVIPEISVPAAGTVQNVSLSAESTISGGVTGSVVGQTVTVFAIRQDGLPGAWFSADASNGSFEITNLSAGSYNLEFVEGSTAQKITGIAVEKAAQVDLGKITLGQPVATVCGGSALEPSPTPGIVLPPPPVTDPLFIAEIEAELHLVLLPALGLLFGSQDEQLWSTFLSTTPLNPSPPQPFADGSELVEGSAHPFGGGFRQSPTSVAALVQVRHDILVTVNDLIQSGQLCSDFGQISRPVADLLQSDPLGNTNHFVDDLFPGRKSLQDADYDDPLSIPGNIAGGLTTGPGLTYQDSRQIWGNVTLRSDGSDLHVISSLGMTVVDNVSFVNGDIIGRFPFETVFTLQLALLESLGFAHQVPFIVRWADRPTDVTIAGLPDCRGMQPQPPFNPGNGGSSPTVGSFDPNSKIGPAGVGLPKFVAPRSPLSYTVDFENDPSATAPAQQVLITDQLNPHLDWSTFRLTEVGFGSVNIAIPPNSQHFETTVSITENGQDFNVQIEAGIDLSTGLFTAEFQSIDPNTQLPPDVLTGFLPPEDGTGRGMGYVSYIVMPKAGLATGTQIRNVALVTFDANQPVATDQVDDHDPSKGVDPTKEDLNTIDAGAPVSSVAALPAIEYTASFPVSWSGQDDPGGSGVASYNVYVSTDGGPFALWLGNTTQTSAAHMGQDGHSYSFYSVATDNVGNVQLAPAAAQASTLVHLPPTVTAATYFYDRLPNSLSFTFSKDVSKTLSLSSIQMKNNTTGAVVSPVAFSYDAGTNTATFTFAVSPLADGRYTATLLAGVIADAGGVKLDGGGKGQPGTDYPFNFLVLTGDLDRDGKVDFADLVTLARHYGQTNTTYSQGDVNYDGVVDFKDLAILARHYANTLPADADGDGILGFGDLVAVARNYGQPGGLAQGDFDADGKVDFNDLVLLARNYGHSLQTSSALGTDVFSPAISYQVQSHRRPAR